ncbi:Hypothetical predicted protein [Octopus vulgaris]|uniref:Uncharacterized protein n=1 Tax=Octopus vulgaris TaxID=6645 RepID=A0AA36BIX2_OCTVU|nr:Hypothetical predicted protein [Octopus vulgaris]
MLKKHISYKPKLSMIRKQFRIILLGIQEEAFHSEVTIHTARRRKVWQVPISSSKPKPFRCASPFIIFVKGSRHIDRLLLF